MDTHFEEDYTKLSSLLAKLKPILTSIETETMRLLTAKSSDEMDQLSLAISQLIFDAQSIHDDYREATASLLDKVTKMDAGNDKDNANNQLNEFMEGVEEGMQTERDQARCLSFITKLESKYSRALKSATTRITALSSIAPNHEPAQPNLNASLLGDNSATIPYRIEQAEPANEDVHSHASFHSANDSFNDRLSSLEVQLRNSNPTHPKLVLPPVQLESFDGTDITKYRAYKYQLDMLILNDPNYNEVQKAFYVRSSLRGQALDLVSTIPTNRDFLTKIIDRLELEYNRPNLSQATILQSLLSTRAKSSKLSDQLAATRTMINLVHTLDSKCGLDGMLTRQQIVANIHRRFISIIWRREETTLLKTLQRIEEDLRTDLEDLTITNAIQSNNASHNQSAPNHSDSIRSHKSKLSTSDPSSPSPTPTPKGSKGPLCVFCGKHAYSGECSEVKTVKERKEILKSKSLCHACFSDKHSTNDCTKKCSLCNAKHHKAVCERSTQRSAYSATTSNVQPQRLFIAKVTVCNHSQSHPKKSKAFIHFDNGAQASIISKKLVKQLSLVPFDKREMKIVGINDTVATASSSLYDVVRFDVLTDDGKRFPIEAIVKDTAAISVTYTQPLSHKDLLAIQQTLGTVPHHFTKCNDVRTDILLCIGDSMELLEHAKETKLPSGYRLVQSSFGPLVVGSTKDRRVPSDTAVSVLTTTTVDTFEQKIERMLSVDPAARVYETTEKESRKATDDIVNQHFKDTVEKRGDEYFVQYSVKPEAASELPDNYELAVSRLCSTVKKLSKNQSNLEFYDSIIRDQLSLGQIELVDPNDREGLIHYLAHQPVMRPDKITTPLRIVYDASAHLKNKPCLNDMIHPGPSDLEMIPALLLRARSRQTLIVADVEKAFLQVKLHPSQRNMLRFLWIKDLHKPVTQNNILVLRFCVTPFGVNASPSLLAKVINHHITLNASSCDTDLVNQLITNLYVDNVIINIDKPSPNVYDQSKHLFQTMGMNLRDYASNNEQFMSMVAEADRSKDEVQKLLGLLWNVKTDQLSINIPNADKSGKVTKRTMLSDVASPFDPLGLLNPLILPPRLTIQQLWNLPLKWDDLVSDCTKDAFHQQMNEIENFSLSFKRYSHLSDNDCITLVAFSDASKHSMTACIYSWSPDVDPTLLISKTRLAPIKCKSTIPKMELDSLVIAHQLIRFTVETLRKEFPTKPIHVYFYSDSAVVLHWCKHGFSKPLGVFVTNRVKKIHDTEKDLSVLAPLSYHNPRHVRSEDNPADHGTRGLSSKEMNDPNHQWWIGPSWLKSPPDVWPNVDLASLQGPPIDSFPVHIGRTIAIPIPPPVIDLTRFSTLRRAITVTAMVYRFISRRVPKFVKDKLPHLADASSDHISPNERRFAFNALIRLHQSRFIHVHESDITKHKIVEDPVTRLWKLNTRLTNASLTSEAKSPVFIPTSKDSTLAKLIITDVHLSSTHSNTDAVLNQVKRKYWIPRCRQIAKTVGKSCVPCRKTNNLPFRYPVSPALPEHRVTRSKPFEHCGVDYAGPFSSNDNTKMYAIVFTCFSTRMAHIEVVNSLLPSDFMLAFRRFCARRGTPTHITSDNATTLKLSSTLFAKPDDDPNLNTLLSKQGIAWHFTTAHSPWKGGIYERLIKIVKDSLSRAIGKRKLSQHEFTTVICEVEAVLNSRPLTYVSSDDVHSFTGPVLRPIDLISPNSYLGCPIILSDSDSDYKLPQEENSSREGAIRQLKRSIDVVDQFWQRWNDEYLTTIRDSSSKSDPLQSTRSSSYLPTVGSVVLVVDESGNTPRSTWKMAKILTLTDTSATLRSHAGRIIERPLNLLIPLEIHSREGDIASGSRPPPLYQPLFNPSVPTASNEVEIPFKTEKDIKKDPAPPRSKLTNNIVAAIDKKLDEKLEQILTPLVRTVEDAVTVLVKEIKGVNANMSQHRSALSKFQTYFDSAIRNVREPIAKTPLAPIVVPSTTPVIPHTRATSSRDLSNIPSSSRTHDRRTNHRSRSPISRRRDRSRSRSPIRQSNVPNAFTSKNFGPQCVFCKSTGHLSKACTIVTSVNTRNEMMTDLNRCKKCFRIRNHTHHADCEPELCKKGCVNKYNVPERHCDWFCPRNPDLTP